MNHTPPKRRKRPPGWLRASEVADLCGTSDETVRRAILAGILPASRTSARGHYRIRQEDAETYRRSLAPVEEPAA